ncbi:MAG TPA: Fic family protein [Solirubrobacterales bacterium]|jgi:Fic family protein|nr:Fic family protein [Solirubrobacterales bacterium]
MISATPTPTPELRAQLDELDKLRDALGHEAGRTVPWIGALRRQVRASSVEGSTSIEGFSVAPGEAVALVSGDRQVDFDDENGQAVACYARAMDHVGVMAADPSFAWSDRVILDLHFDACSFQRSESPGRWRGGPVGVTGSDGRIRYQAPDSGEVPGLMAEVIEWLQNGDRDSHTVVRAAMAHLHVVSVHPFRDGNGRISRIVQSLVLAGEGLMSPEFGSIEEYLGEHTTDYYAALNEAHGPRYQPERDASGWIAFCVKAHLSQARQRLAQIEEAAARWSHLEQLVGDRAWPDRLVIALEQSLLGGANRASYAAEAGVSLATASADFRRLLDSGLVAQQGQGRSVRYRASEGLRAEATSAIETQRRA